MIPADATRTPINIFLLSFSFKKTTPKKTAKIGAIAVVTAARPAPTSCIAKMNRIVAAPAPRIPAKF